MDCDFDFYVPKEKFFGETIQPYKSQNNNN